MLILTGMSGTGKSTILEKLCKDYGYEKVVTYTTRPMRDGEVNGADYNFISVEDFEEKVKNDFFAEHKFYDTVYGRWYYGTSKCSICEGKMQKKGIILTPNGIDDLLSIIDSKKVFRLVLDEKTLIHRLKNRGDNEDEIVRRLLRDKEDFANVKADFVINANNGIDDICRFIDLMYANGFKKGNA